MVLIDSNVLHQPARQEKLGKNKACAMVQAVLGDRWEITSFVQRRFVLRSVCVGWLKRECVCLYMYACAVDEWIL
jgi:hypothetical protein